METQHEQSGQAAVGYQTRCERLPAFDLVGFTKIVQSGGEQYGEVRSDGRWEVLRSIGGDDPTIYGVASHDKECPKNFYRYTVALKAPEDRFWAAGVAGELFTIHIAESEWVVFTLEHFGRQYGEFWQDNPYELIKKLGWEFNWKVGLHIDVYAPSYSSDDDAMEFRMPVRRNA